MGQTRLRSLAGLVLVAPLLAMTPAAVAGPGPGSGSADRAPDASASFARTADEVRGQGRWEVTPLGAEGHRLTWTSPTVLPMGSDRPVVVRDGEAVGTTTVAEDGRTVSVTVPGDETPSAGDFDVLLSGQVLDAGAPLAAVGEVQKVAPASDVLPADPAAPGPYGSVSSDYTLDPVKVPGARKRIEMVGHVVLPAQATPGPRPLVLFMHGRHSVCYKPGDPDDWGGSRWPCVAPRKEIPSHLGYVHLQKRLASQGYATVSIRVNGINAQDFAMDDGGADARARIVRKHLDHWLTRAAADQVDMDKVVLVGHSRGGEGVNRASIQIGDDAPYRIAGQVLVAPTDFGWQSAPYVPTVTYLPSCDGDVYDLQGQRFTDVSRDLLGDDTSLKSSVLMVGANHNFFNTEWTPGPAAAPAWDDWSGSPKRACGTQDPTRLTAAEQRKVSMAYTAAAVDVFTRDDERFLGLFDGRDVRPSSTGDAVTRSHALGGGRTLVRPGRELSVAPSSTGATWLCTGRTSQRAGDCAPAGATAPHWPMMGEASQPPRSAVTFTWKAAGQHADLALSEPLDLSGRVLDLRTVVDQRVAKVRLAVRLTDASGASAVVTPERNGVLERMGGGMLFGKWWAQNLRVDPAGAAVDLTKVTSISLVGRSASGHVVLLDAAAADGSLAAVPDKRAARITLGDVTQPEGGPGQQVVKIPVTVTGDLTAPAKLRLYRSDEQSRVVSTLQIPAGTTATTIDVPYTGDDVYGGPDYRYVSAYAASGAMTDRYTALASITEDEPAPTITIKPDKTLHKEGDVMRVRVTLSAPMAHDVSGMVEFAKPPGRAMSVNDLRKGVMGAKVPGTKPLHKIGWYSDLRIPAGATSTVVTIPTRRDSRKEGTEQVKLDVWAGYGEIDSVRSMVLKLSDR